MSDSIKKFGIGNGIVITTGFDVSTRLPLDARTVVDTLEDLGNIPDSIRYEGLLVFVVEDNKLYQWKQDLLEDGTYATEYSWGPIESEISAKKIEDVNELDLANIKSLQLQKNKVNFFPITHEKFIYNEKGDTLQEELKEYQKKDLSSDESGEKLETEMQTIVGAINELNSKMEDTIAEFRETITDTINDLNASVEKMQQETAADMTEMKNDLQLEIDNVLADLEAKSKEMDEEFANLLAKVDKQVTDLQDKIQGDIDQMLQDVDNSILSDNQVNNLMEQINANIAELDTIE